MTEDEIKGLTMGDKVYVRARVFYIDSKGMECLVQIYGADDKYWDRYVKAEDVYRALPGKAEGAVKDVACRLFREGDRVRYRERDGRKIFRLQDGAIYEVKRDESAFGTVEVWLYKHERFEVYPYSIFELAIPVEELEPYYIEEKDIEFQVRMKYKDKDCLISVFRFKNIVEGYK